VIRSAYVAVALLALTACGTTVPLTARQQAGLSPQGLSSDGGAATGMLPSAGPAAVDGGVGGSVTTPGGTTQQPGAAPVASGPSAAEGGAGAASTGSGGSAVGVTATTINVGVYTAAGYSKFASSAGFNVALGDQARVARTVIDYINAHGGMAGRKAVPVIHDADLAMAAQNPEAEYQSACTSWTQDAKVYAVVSPIGTGSDTLYTCLSKAGVLTVSAGESRDEAFFTRFADWFYEPVDMNLTRIMRTNADALATAGFFGKAPKIGVVIGDKPDERTALAKGLKPALARHGLSVADTFAVPAGNNGNAAYSSAVLKFRSEGITHVLFGFLGSPLLFMTNAENQGYRPLYGLHSRNSPAAVIQQNAPAAQQRGAMGTGWQPMNDVDGNHDPGILNARQKTCLDLTKKAGQDNNVRATALLALWICDGLFFLRDSLASTRDLSPAGFRKGAEGLGAFPAASTFRSAFAPGRLHDGASAYRLFAYKTDCSCYQYTSPLRTAP
jgi:ABC-type branched-subunit amino acid transport system substrate-binding protein